MGQCKVLLFDWLFVKVFKILPGLCPEKPEEAGKLPLGVCKLQEEDQKPITPCGRRVHRGNGSVKSLF